MTNRNPGQPSPEVRQIFKTQNANPAVCLGFVSANMKTYCHPRTKTPQMRPSQPAPIQPRATLKVSLKFRLFSHRPSSFGLTARCPIVPDSLLCKFRRINDEKYFCR
jgi:hypothetical protein